jgi:hypothetical protein
MDLEIKPDLTDADFQNLRDRFEEARQLLEAIEPQEFVRSARTFVDRGLAGNSSAFVHRQIAAQLRSGCSKYCWAEFLRRQTSGSARRKCVVSSRAKPMYPAAQISAPMRRTNSLVLNR